jgi:hypothetical protein
VLSATLLRLTAAVLVVIAPTLLSAQVQRKVSTAKRDSLDTPVPHPLSWWTKDPLRLDASGDLLIGKPANDGAIVTAQDYRVHQTVTTLGTIAGFRIMQILTTIDAGPRIIAAGWASAGEPPAQWKSLLVQAGSQAGSEDQYVEIYALQAESGLYQAMKPAAIYGVGPEAILGTYDPDSGNGGGCDDGYWWFDKSGPHAVDFSPLKQAISRVIPHNQYIHPQLLGAASRKSGTAELGPKKRCRVPRLRRPGDYSYTVQNRAWCSDPDLCSL